VYDKMATGTEVGESGSNLSWGINFWYFPGSKAEQNTGIRDSRHLKHGPTTRTISSSSFGVNAVGTFGDPLDSCIALVPQ
jgi:hypothetical protein